MDAFKLQLFLHVAAVLVALGATFSYPVIQALAEKKGVAATRLGLQFIERIDTILTLPGAVVVLLLGAGLIFAKEDGKAIKDDFPLWLGIAIVWFLVCFAFSLFVQRPTSKKALATLDGVPDGPTLPAAYAPLSKRLQAGGMFLGISVIAITFLMVWQPGS